MRVTITKTGGFAGVHQQLGPVETSSLDSEVADQVGRIVTDVDFFNLPESLPAQPVMDGFSYAVRIADGERDHTVRTEGTSNDPAATGLHEMISFLDQAVGFQECPIVANNPEGVVETRDWSAWYNRMPGADDPDLHVTGICGLASSSITVRLAPGNVGVVPEPDLYALDLVVTIPEIGDERYLEREVTWAENVGQTIKVVRINNVGVEITVQIVE